MAPRMSSEHNIPIEIVELVLNFIDDIDGKDDFGNTALHEATFRRNINTLKYLLEKNADVNAKNFDGRTPLHLISLKYWDVNCIECIKTLIDHKADVNAVDKDLISPLHLACLNKNIAVAKYFIENGADSSLRDNDGRTVFHYGCMVNTSHVPEPQFEDYRKIQTEDILNLFIEEELLVNCVDKFEI
ncbi:putative ankyrin repeat protein RF_0580 [Chelonus insularis]|uniref:putative ankyrin repeat protein RF_0580 n=1 Tax=Chelonus insularis TaxID=460826 RepID=UPI00158EDB93|nr:putative ankyrin repeat protein RF_0580 [Chelonus insularis]